MSSISGRVRVTFSLFVLSLLLPLSVFAAQRTYVATTGSDANTASNCSNTAPCRGFTAALTVTDWGGEIIVLNSGGYGPVTINKSVSIIATEGVHAGIFALNGNAITIATTELKVVLRGLTIYGHSLDPGVYMTAGEELTIENCHISNFSKGLHVNTPAKVRVSRSVFLNNYQGALFEGWAQAVVEDTEVSGGMFGIHVHAEGADIGASASVSRSTINFTDFGASATATRGGTTLLAVKDSVLVNNGHGGWARANGGTTVASFSNNLIFQNWVGLEAGGAGSTLTASGNTITNWGTGLVQLESAVLESTGDNIVRQNGTAVSGTVTSVPKM